MRSAWPWIPFLCLLPAALDPPPARAAANATLDSIRYVVRVADQNAVGVTLTNYGVIGNNFVSRSPSLEYPLGTGCEHLTAGGLWFGAQAVDGEIGRASCRERVYSGV